MGNKVEIQQKKHTFAIKNVKTGHFHDRRSELEEQKEMIVSLQRQQEALAEQLKHSIPDELMLLHEQTRQHHEHIELTSDMTDEELMA